MARRAFVLSLLAACGPSEGKKGECRDSLVVGDLVITEVFADFRAPTGGTGADEGKEWFEIYNASDRPIELEGLRIDHSRPDGDNLKSHVMEAVTIAPGQFFTLGNATADLVPAYIDYGYSADLGDFFNSDGGTLRLACGDTEIDLASYDTIEEGRSRQLTAATFPDYTLNDDLMNWCEAAASEFEEDNFGTPGAESDCTPVILGLCNDNGTMREVVAPQPGELVITELMPDPAGTDGGQEWFEAKALASFDLNGLTLDRASEAANTDTIESPDCIAVTAGDYVVFANGTDPATNGGLPVDSIRGIFGFSLTQGSVATPGDIQILSGATLIDSVTYTASDSGIALALDPDLEDATANDQESNFCAGVGAYGPGGAGTPGAANGQCTLLPPAGMCDDGGTIRPIKKPLPGELVITEYLANPAALVPPVAGIDDNDREWFEIQNISAAEFDLNELDITRLGNATPSTVASANCISVAPGGLALFARSAINEENGMLGTVDATFNFSLVDSGANRSIQIFDGATEIDSITYTATGTSANSAVAPGKSVQLDDNNLLPAANDVMNPTAGLICQGATAYGDGTNTGTPRLPNVNCP